MGSIYLEPQQLHKILLDVYKMGVDYALAEMGVKNKYISQNQANKRYGRMRVKAWINEGLVTIHKDGDGNKMVRLSIAELDIAAATNRYKVSEEHPK